MGHPQKAPGTIATPYGFRRMPGTQVNYSRRDTIFYKSQRARYWRGARMRPDRRENVGGFGTLQYKFWFRSPRGPAAQNGFHVVEADLNNPVGGGGGGGGFNPPVGHACPVPAGYSFIILTFAAKHVVGSPFVFNDTNYDPGVDADFNPPASTTGVSGPDPRGVYFMHSPGNIYYGVRISFTSSETPYVPATATEVTLVRFQTNSGTLYDAASSGDFAGLPLTGPWCDGDFFGFGSNEVGGGGGPPRYTCTCPDYTKVERVYLTPVWRSQVQARSWATSRAGADGYCKHIYSAAFALGDQAVVANVPAGLLPPEQVPDFFKWLRWNEQLVRRQWEIERAYARESLGAARRAGEAARDRYYRAIVEGTLAGQASAPAFRNLPGLRDSAEVSGITLDPYAYNSLSAIGRNRRFNSIPVGSRPASTAWVPPELTIEDYPAYMYGEDLSVEARAARLRAEVQAEAPSELGALIDDAFSPIRRSVALLPRPTFWRRGPLGIIY